MVKEVSFCFVLLTEADGWRMNNEREGILEVVCGGDAGLEAGEPSWRPGRLPCHGVGSGPGLVPPAARRSGGYRECMSVILFYECI